MRCLHARATLAEPAPELRRARAQASRGDRTWRTRLERYEQAVSAQLSERPRVATPCIVEYRRGPARNGHDLDAALQFVAAALRGTVSRRAVGEHDADRTPVAARDIVSVRATATHTEWTPRHPPR